MCIFMYQCLLIPMPINCSIIKSIAIDNNYIGWYKQAIIRPILLSLPNIAASKPIPFTNILPSQNVANLLIVAVLLWGNPVCLLNSSDMKKIILMLGLVMIFLVVVIQNYPIKNENWSYDGLFIPPNIIIINGYTFDEGTINWDWYKQTLVHEYSHYICYTLFDDYWCNDKEWEEEDKKLKI